MANNLAVANQDVIYSDVNVELGRSSPYELVYNEDAIKHSILNIIGTRKKSRPFNRGFGSSILDLVFDPLDDMTAAVIQTRMFDEIAAQETRVVLQQVEVLPDYANDQFYVSIVGYMPQLENQRFDFNFNLQRSST